MARKVLVLSPHQVQLPSSPLFQAVAQDQRPHILLCVLSEPQDYAWMKEHTQELEVCPIKLVLAGKKRELPQACLLAKQMQGLSVFTQLNEAFVQGYLTDLVNRLEAIYGAVFDRLASQSNILTKEDLLAAANLLKKPQDQTQIARWLAEASARESAQSLSRTEFLQWCASGRLSSTHLVPEIVVKELKESGVLGLCGADFVEMMLSPDSEDVESSFGVAVNVGAEVSETPNLYLKAQLDIKKEDPVTGVKVTISLQVPDTVDVSAAKTALESSISDLLKVLRPLDRNELVFPLLQVKCSMAHRKVVVSLTLLEEGVVAILVSYFKVSVQPLLDCGFAQFVEMQVKSEMNLEQLAKEQERTVFECLTDSLEVSFDSFYWGFYRNLLAAVLPNAQGPLQLVITLILAALKDGALELEFGSAEELPSFVLSTFHAAIQRYPFLSLFRVRQFLAAAQEPTAQVARQLLQTLASSFDPSGVEIKAQFQTLEVGVELRLPGLFRACI